MVTYWKCPHIWPATHSFKRLANLFNEILTIYVDLDYQHVRLFTEQVWRKIMANFPLRLTIQTLYNFKGYMVIVKSSFKRIPLRFFDNLINIYMSLINIIGAITYSIVVLFHIVKLLLSYLRCLIFPLVSSKTCKIKVKVCCLKNCRNVRKLFN